MTDLFNVILTDPPWKYYGASDKWGAAAKFYNCLSYEEIRDIRPPLVKPGVLFMWTTSAFMEKSIALINDWGLTYRGVAFVWIKTSLNGKPFGARGVRPSITKPLTEFVIAASNIPKGRPLPLNSEAVQQTIFAPPREHSRKPDEVYEAIEEMYPDSDRLEMFARNGRWGWISQGNETEKFGRV